MQLSLREVNNLLQVTQLRGKTGFKPRGSDSRAQALSLPPSCLSADKPVMFSHILYLASASMVFYSENFRIFEQGQRSRTQQVWVLALMLPIRAMAKTPSCLLFCGTFWSLYLGSKSEFRLSGAHTSMGTCPLSPHLHRRQQCAQGHFALRTNMHEPWLLIGSRNTVTTGH